jgi:hypothetical protein
MKRNVRQTKVTQQRKAIRAIVHSLFNYKLDYDHCHVKTTGQALRAAVLTLHSIDMFLLYNVGEHPLQGLEADLILSDKVIENE